MAEPGRRDARMVTTLAAVRRRILPLAVGGTAFDELFLVVSGGGPSRRLAPPRTDARGPLLALLWLVMTAVSLARLSVCQRDEPGRIGVESASILALHAAAVSLRSVAE
jgi:cation:H+ antiporter